MRSSSPIITKESYEREREKERERERETVLALKDDASGTLGVDDKEFVTHLQSGKFISQMFKHVEHINWQTLGST
jgi:hypothetical protein